MGHRGRRLDRHFTRLHPVDTDDIYRGLALRPARWGEALNGNAVRSIRIAFAHLIVIGAAIGVIVLLRLGALLD